MLPAYFFLDNNLSELTMLKHVAFIETIARLISISHRVVEVLDLLD